MDNKDKDTKDKDSSKDLLFLDPESKSGASPFLVDKTNANKNTNTTTTTTPEVTKVKPKFEKLPPSSILSRARDFLPTMAEANKKLESDVKNNNTNVNIEDVDESKPYIQMKLALGVLEEQKELTEDTITIPNNNNNNTEDDCKPIIEILAADSSDDSGDSDKEEDKDEDVKMKESNNDQT